MHPVVAFTRYPSARRASAILDTVENNSLDFTMSEQAHRDIRPNPASNRTGALALRTNPSRPGTPHLASQRRSSVPLQAGERLLG